MSTDLVNLHLPRRWQVSRFTGGEKCLLVTRPVDRSRSIKSAAGAGPCGLQ